MGLRRRSQSAGLRAASKQQRGQRKYDASCEQHGISPPTCAVGGGDQPPSCLRVLPRKPHTTKKNILPSAFSDSCPQRDRTAKNLQHARRLIGSTVGPNFIDHATPA